MTHYRWLQAAAFAILWSVVVQATPPASDLLGKAWHPINPSAETAAPLTVEAAGWQSEQMDLERTPESAWYSEGDEMQHWAWKAVLTNPTDEPVTFSLVLQLRSSMGYYFQTLNAGPEQGWTLAPGETRTFQGQGAYDATSHEREGDAVTMDLQVIPTS